MKRNIFAMILVAIFAIALTSSMVGCKKEEAPPADIPTMEQPAEEAAAPAAPVEEAKKK